MLIFKENLNTDINTNLTLTKKMSNLTINLNEEYRIKIENGNEFHESIFSEVYFNAARNVAEIIKQSDKSSKINKYNDFNNIIAFTGERGKGKSSSMISFHDALVGNKDKKHSGFFNVHTNEDPFLKDILEILRNKTFAEIDIIDPSLFRESESLFEIILAKMFSKFQQKINERGSGISDDSRRIIIKYFQMVFENLQIIKGDRKDLYKQETIEALSNLATSSNLRECFRKLIQEYLKNFEEKDFLIISIDDFDLNVSGAYEMLEDIRQFLIQNNIIILIACKIEQLIEALIIHYDKVSLKEDKENKAYRYLDKLIPFGRRSNLPNIDSLKNINLKICEGDKTIFDNSKLDIVKGVSDVLYKNYSIFIPSNKIRNKSIFPKTIRETQYLFNILQNRDNYSLLKKYILDETYKKDIYHHTFLELDNCSDTLFNLLFIRKINEKINEKSDLLKNLSRVNINRLSSETLKLSVSTIPENISIGDVFNSIHELENIIEVDNFKLLTFVDYLKFYYIVRINTINEDLHNLEFLKYGFYNGKFKIISEESGTAGIRSRDFVKFNIQIVIDKLSTEEKFILSMMMYSLGDNENYRNDSDKELFINGYKKGILSPLSIFNNAKNLDILSEIFDFDKSNIFVVNNLMWFEKSQTIKHLCNPYFSLELFSELNKFRRREIKDTLPRNYFDVLCLLFIYGTLDSLRNMELKYDYVDDLSYEFASYPLVISLVKFFLRNPENLKYKKVKELNDIYFNEIDSNPNNFVSSDLVNSINDVYNNSGDNSYERKTNELILDQLRDLYLNLSLKSQYTFRTISPYLNNIIAIDPFSSVVDDLNGFKKGINNKDSDTYFAIKEYLKNAING